MQFHNDSKAKFVHYFGEGALSLVKGYQNVVFIMAELGMFPAIEELGPIAACVTETRHGHLGSSANRPEPSPGGIHRLSGNDREGCRGLAGTAAR